MGGRGPRLPARPAERQEHPAHSASRSRPSLPITGVPTATRQRPLHHGKPTESVWSHLKRSLANLAKRNIAQLTALTKTRLRHMQYQPGLVEGFLTGTELDLTPSVTPAIEDR